MKLSFNKAALALYALMALALASCSEGKYWDAPSNPGEVYAFLKPAATVTVGSDEAFPTSYEVKVRRNSNKGEATVPVTLKASSDKVTGPAEVTFADGSYEAVYPLSLSDLQMGVDYTATLTLAQPEDATVHVNASNLKFAFKISKAFIWETVGTVTCVEDLFGAEPTEVPIQQAVNYPDKSVKLMRLNSPFYYMFGENTAKGVNLLFFLNPDDSAKSMYVDQGFQYIGVNYEGAGYLYFGVISKYGGSFTNDGNVYTMAGVMGAADSTTSTSPAAKWYENIQFIWNK